MYSSSCSRSRTGWQRTAVSGLSLIELLVVLAIIGVLLGFLIPAVQAIRARSQQLECSNNLRQIGLALHQYHDVNKSFPPGISYRDGADPYPWLGWQARILPFIEREDLWRLTVAAFAQDSWFENNPPHIGFATVLPLYSCPADARTSIPALTGGMQVALTSYLGNEGRDYLRTDGVLFLDSQITTRAIVDGTSNTLLVGERPPSSELNRGWWYGGWGQNKDGSTDVVIGALELCNGSYNTASCPPGPYQYGPGSLSELCDLFHYWSLHSGGANFLFADGSVHFLAYSAAPIMPALATRAGGEVVAIE